MMGKLDDYLKNEGYKQKRQPMSTFDKISTVGLGLAFAVIVGNVIRAWLW